MLPLVQIWDSPRPRKKTALWPWLHPVSFSGKQKLNTLRAIWRYRCRLQGMKCVAECDDASSINRALFDKGGEQSSRRRGERDCSVILQVVHDIERVIHNKPFDSVLKISRQHLLAVADLLRLGVIIVLNLQLVHVEL